MKEINPIENTKTLIRELLGFLDASPWRELYHSRLECLMEKADLPCELAIAGRVKAGKSSFLNALLGKDLAMVGTTETTATINFFKYGKPIDDKHTVKVVWEDGHEEWQGIDFLNSLQGNSQEVINRAKGIDHLEYFVDNPELANITLVDTPGTGALVDEHNQRTSDYLKLREKHEQQSVKLKDRADAVIIIVGHVPSASGKQIVEDFTDNTSSFNSIGVMSKIDDESSITTEEWHARCEEYTKSLSHQLNTIMPVSAGVYHWTKKLKEENRLEYIQSKVRLLEGFSKEEIDEVFSSLVFENKNFDKPEGKSIEEDLFNPVGLTRNVRLDMLRGMEQCYSVFATIAKQLYFNPIDVAEKNLLSYSGMDEIRKVLENQFFKRSRIIRCSKITNELHDLLYNILHQGLYNTKLESRFREEYLNIITSSSASDEVKDSFKKFVEKNIVTEDKVKLYEARVQDLIKKVEDLQIAFKGTDKKTEGLLLLEKYSQLFSSNEIEELETLFGKRTDIDTSTLNPKRRGYWQAKLRKYMNNPEVVKLIKQAIYIYGTYNNK